MEKDAGIDVISSWKGKIYNFGRKKYNSANNWMCSCLSYLWNYNYIGRSICRKNDVLKNIFWCRYIFVFVFEINDSWTGCNRIDIFHSCLVMEINCKNIQGFEIWQLKTFWVTKVWKIDVYNFRFSLWRKSFANLSKALESSASMISESEININSSEY